jgi:PBSX family phage terminase large subunit
MNPQSLLDLLDMAKTPEQKKALIKAISEKDKVSAIARFNLDEMLFKEQLEVLKSPAKNKVIVCSRRSGKSYMISAALLQKAMSTPDSVHLYIGLTKASARNVIWSILTRMIEDYKLPCVFNEHTLTIKFNNRSRIIIEGCKDQTTIERLRGMALHTAVIDECQAVPTQLANSLISEIISPALKDYNGELILAGTPCALLKSILYLAWNGDKPYKNFEKFHWNVTNNVKFPRFVSGVSTPETYLEEICNETGYKTTDPGFQREFLGNFVEDKDSLVYGFDPDRDVCESLPAGHEWSYIVSCDLGFNDSDAAVVGAFSYTHRIAYVVETFSEAGQDFSTMAEKIRELNEKYNPIMTIVDSGSGGLKFVSELNHRYGIRAKPAEKYNPKAGGCAMMADSFRKQEFKVLDNDSNQILIAQLSNITFLIKTDKDGNTKRVVPDGKNVVTANGIIGDDAADACLYLFKACRNYLSTELETYTPEQLQTKLIEDHKAQVMRADQRRIREANKPRVWI